MQTLADFGQFDVHDFLQVLFGQLAEHDHLIQTAEEFRLELFLDLEHEISLHVVETAVLIGGTKADSGALRHCAGARVGGHDEHNVLEVDLAAEAVGQMAFLHDLQQHVKDVGVGLLDFVEQHHCIGASSNLLCQLPPLFVAHVTRRRAD